MALDNVKNFIKAQVNPHDESAITWQLHDVSDVVKFPQPPFNITVYNDTDYPDASDDPNVEIYRVTSINIGNGTLVGLRAQEDTAATSKNIQNKKYLMRLAPTAKLVNDIDQHIENKTIHRPIRYHESDEHAGVKWAWFDVETNV